MPNGLLAPGQGCPSAEQSNVHKTATTKETGLVWILQSCYCVYENLSSDCKGPDRWVSNEENVTVYLKNKNYFLQLINHGLTLCPNRKPNTVFLKLKNQFPNPKNSFKAIFPGTLQANLGKKRKLPGFSSFFGLVFNLDILEQTVLPLP